jgi:hypothetical protein
MQMQQLAARETLRERLTRFMRERAARSVREAKSRPPPPTLDQLVVEDARAVADEIAAVDRRLAEIDRLLKARPAAGAWGGADYESQELASERHRLRDVRRDIEADQACPVAFDRDGRPLDAHWRVVRRARARELRESYWAEAEAARAEGDHRRARQLRLDALRARQLAEVELRWRTVPHYW